jgi:hypothetical protein
VVAGLGGGLASTEKRLLKPDTSAFAPNPSMKRLGANSTASQTQAAELGSGGGTRDLRRLFISFWKWRKPRPEAILTVRLANDSGWLIMVRSLAASFSAPSNFSRDDSRLAMSLRLLGSTERDLSAGSG